MTSNTTVIVAAAGSGKTTRLVAKYLGMLGKGLTPREIIAITFTRAAGAELQERIDLALRAGQGEPAAIAHLGAAWTYELSAVTPRDPALIARAQRGMADAPIGTTDSFVQRLLGEFGLHARIQVGAESVPLDIPLGLGDPERLYEQAARALLDPASGKLPDEAQRALRELTFGDLLKQVVQLAMAPPRHKLLSCDEVFPTALALAGDALRATYVGTAHKPLKATGQDVVKPWIDAGAPDPVPAEAVAYCAGRTASSVKAKDADALREAVAGLPTVDFGTTALPGRTLIKACADWTTPESRQRADQLRSDLTALAAQVHKVAPRACAAAGELDYAMLTQAAMTLCQAPPERLRSRFKALLVDEAQDASPEQMALYAALSALPGDERGLETVYVGDPRQSIYLFRGAEPALFDALVERYAQTGQREELMTNYRSTPELVAAQRALFGRTAELGLQGVLDVSTVTAGRKSQNADADGKNKASVEIALPSEDSWNVDVAREKTLTAFFGRLQSEWQRPDPPSETAAVLAPTWNEVTAACAWLNARQDGWPAFVQGSKALASSQPVRDLRTLVRALWDPTQRIACAGLWKLPCVGLSDGGLALLAQGRGVLGGLAGFCDLTTAIYGQALDPAEHAPADVAAFACAAPVLRRALARIGREPTADLLEQVATDLHWRAVLKAGPGNDEAVAQLEVALDWIRASEAQGVDPSRVLDLLDPDKEEEDAPKVLLERGARVITCTTVHQAKGLEFDHVCVLGAGYSPEARDDGGAAIWQSEPVTLLGVKLDPAGALRSQDDPLGSLGPAIGDARRQYERLRLVYVAITRAKKSVTLGLTGQERGIDAQLTAAWQQWPAMPDSIQVVDPITAIPEEPSYGYAVAAGQLERQVARRDGWQVLAPSSAGRGWSPTAVEELMLRLLRPASEGGVTVVGNQKRLDMHDLVRKLDGDKRGEVLHGWMAAGGLDAVPSRQRAADYLRDHWQLTAGPLAEALTDWLVGLAVALPQRQPELYAAMTDPAVERHFEVPMVGVAQLEQRDFMYPGRMDLLLRWPDGRVWVVDFKGANVLAEGKDEAGLVERAKLRTYGPQLEAYRMALLRMGLRVERVSLLFAGAWDWVWWGD